MDSEKQPGRLIAWIGLPILIALLLLAATALRPFGRPSSTVRKALDALATGDAARLREDDRLGFKSRAELEIRRLGTTEYARILGLFDKEAQLGDREYRRVRRIVGGLGEKEFRKLSKDDQRTLREFSKRQFVAEKGWAQLVEDERKQLGSQDALGDRKKLRARAIAVGLPTLPEDQQTAAAGQDLTSPDAAKDRKLAKIAAAAEKAGMAELAPALQSAEQAATVELMRLSRRERDRVENGSYFRWVFEAGLKSADDKTRAKANLAQLVDDDAPEAWTLRRSFGFKDLDPESRKTLEPLDYDKLVAGRREFIDQQGMRLWGEQLRETFNAGCCKTGTTRYLGESGRSLRRNSSATVALEYGPPPPPKPRAPGEKPKVEDDNDGKHPAQKYLGQTVVLEYRWGSWAIVGFDQAGEDSAGKHHSMEAAALGALLGLGSTASGFVLFGALGLVILLTVLLKRKPAVNAAELAAAGAVLALASLQLAFEGQVTLDDVWFAPLYMALPIWVGARRGSESGFVAGFLAGIVLVIVSAVAGVPSWASAGGNGLPLGEHLLAAVMLAATGTLAGRVRKAAVALPLYWVLFFAVVDRSQLASLSLYAHVLLACAATSAGFLLETFDVLTPVKKFARNDDLSV
jgi:thiamine transporter ThiT